MDKYKPPGGNFASVAVWHTIVLKDPAFLRESRFFSLKLTDVTIWSKILNSIQIAIVIDRTWFS